MKIHKFALLFLSLLFLISLAACSTQRTPKNDPITTPTLVNQPEETVLPVPTATAETIQKTLMYVKMNVVNRPLDAELQTILGDYANQHQLKLMVSDSLDENLAVNADLILLDQPPQDLLSVPNKFPETKFIVISSQKTDLPENTYQIYTPVEDVYFIAGYTAALISEDWRAAAIVPDDSIDGTSLAQIFSNGTKYLCGLCAPLYAPVVFFPLVAKAPLGADASAVEFAYGEIANSRPNVIFIPSKFLTSDIATSLRQNGILILSDNSGDSLSNELSDLRIYYSVNNSLNALLTTDFSSESHLLMPEVIVNSTISKLSPGKTNNLEQIISDLQLGYISPFSVP